jgi:hypothetical protein
MRPLSSLPLFGSPVEDSPVEEPTRNRPRESTRYPEAPGARDAAGPSKDASTTICGAARESKSAPFTAARLRPPGSSMPCTRKGPAMQAYGS